MTTLPTGDETGNAAESGEGGASPAAEGAAELAALAAEQHAGVTIDVRIDASGEMTEEADPARPRSGGGPYCMKVHPEAHDSPCQREPHEGIDGRHYHPNIGWWGG